MDSENAKLIDSNDMGEELYDVYCPLFGYSISMIVEPDGTEMVPFDFQCYQPKTLEECTDYEWRDAEQIDY